MGFPSEKNLKKMREKLEKAEGTLALSKNPTALEKFRWEICQKLIHFKRVNKCSQKEMAERAGVDEAKISKIMHHRIDEFSTDRLITIYERVNPKIQLKIS